MVRVTVLFLNGGCASTAILPMEIFRFAGVLWDILQGESPQPPFSVTTATLGGAAVAADHLLSLSPSCALESIERPDLVFVPAGGLPLETLVRSGYGVDEVIERNAGVVPWLRRWAAEGARVAGVCSGVALLAEAGLLDGKRATTHWGLTELYRRRFPAVMWDPEFLIADAGDVVTSGGINSAADLSLYLVERFSSREVALNCAKALLIEMPRTWQVAFAQSLPHRNHRDEAIRRAEAWLRENFRDSVGQDAIAARLGMSSRNFLRRFKEATGHTPLSYLHALRIAAAKQLLESERRTVQEVGQAVGYDDVIFFRGLFKRHTGVCPTEYRSRFGSPVIAKASPDRLGLAERPLRPGSSARH